MSSESEPTPVDDILADAAERTADRKSRTKRTPGNFSQWTKFDGVADVDINIRIPNSYFEAVKEFCQISNVPVREWFNDIIIDQIEAIDLDFVKDTFIKKYHLRELSRDQKDALIQAFRGFNLVEETLSDE